MLWTPCSGVKWRVFEPTIRVWRCGTTRKQPANLAVEGCGLVPVHPLRLHTHRTSPAQALLTTLTRHADPTSDLFSHFHRRVSGLVSTSGLLRAERVGDGDAVE